MADLKPDVSYKVLVLGDLGVGKTSILRQLNNKGFSEKVLTTVAPDFVRIRMGVEGSLVELCVWDTPGREEFRSVTRQQFAGVQGVVLVYSITDRDSFKLMDHWIDLLEQDSGLSGSMDEHMPMVMFGNKVDLADKRAVSTELGVKLSERRLMVGFGECSAVTGEGLAQPMYRLASYMADSFHPSLHRPFSPCTEGTEMKLLPRPSESDKTVKTWSPHRPPEKFEEKNRLCCCNIS